MSRYIAKSKMKIAYSCTYSAGISGVWNRVYNVAEEMIKRGHEVYVFSSNLEAGTMKKMPEFEIIDGIKVYRFDVRSFGSRNAFLFKSGELRKRLGEIMPDVIDCQTYRHSEGNIISKEAVKLGIPCFLTTHAPFMPSEIRGKWLSLLSSGYDFLIGKKVLKRFRKIIAISKWEYPCLNKLGVKNERIAYVPNGIPAEFFEKERFAGNRVRNVLFFGRITPVKDVETLVRAWDLIEKEHKNIALNIAGPAESAYRKEIDNLIKKLGLKNIVFRGAVFETRDRLNIYDNAEIFVLPSKREGMPQSLIEAMARGDIVIASDITACREIVKNGKNGYLFRQGDAFDLSKKIDFAIRNYHGLKRVAEKAKLNASAFRWAKIANRLEKVYNN